MQVTISFMRKKELIDPILMVLFSFFTMSAVLCFVFLSVSGL